MFNREKKGEQTWQNATQRRIYRSDLRARKRGSEETKTKMFKVDGMKDRKMDGNKISWWYHGFLMYCYRCCFFRSLSLSLYRLLSCSGLLAEMDGYAYFVCDCAVGIVGWEVIIICVYIHNISAYYDIIVWHGNSFVHNTHTHTQFLFNF